MRNHVLLTALFCLLLNASFFAQSNCNTDVSIRSTFTSMASPLNGPYQPGELVTFCFNIDGFDQTDCNWLHGLVPEFGEGWDPSSFLSSGQPKNISIPLQKHTNGFWVWFPDNWVSYKTNSVAKDLSPGDGAGAGWYFQNFAEPSINPFDPNFTRGDGTDCSLGDNTWEVCFSLITKELYDCPDIVDCSVSFTTFGDGETGSHGTPACMDDQKVEFSAILDCCNSAEIDPISDRFICNNETINIPITSDGDPNAEYSWTVETFNLTGATAGSGNVIQDQLTLINEGFTTYAIYTVTAVIDGCEGASESFQVNISNLDVDLGDDLHICSGTTVRIGEFPVGGASPYTYNWEHGPTNYRPLVSPTETTSYYLTVTDAFGCSTTDDITVFVGQAGPIDGPADLCGLNFGTYTIPPFPGATSYTWTVPSGATIISGQGSRTLRVNWTNSNGGELCVRPNNGCVNGLTDNCITVSSGANTNLGLIIGNENPCPNSIESYSINATDPNTSFTWTVQGGDIVSGQGTDVVEIEWNDTQNNNPQGQIFVTGDNACGSSSTEKEIVVEWGALFTMTGDYRICSGQLGSYDVTVWNGNATQFEWTVSAGAVILSGQGTTSLLVNWSGATEVPYISLTVYTDCVANADGAPVIIFDEDDLNIAGPTEVCAGEVVEYRLDPYPPGSAMVEWIYPTNFHLLSNPNNFVIRGNWVNDSDGIITAEIDVCDVNIVKTAEVTASVGAVIDTTFVLCPGACAAIAGETFCDAGVYTINNPSGGNCGDIINVFLFYLDTPDVMAVAGDDTNVGCTVTTLLDASASTYSNGSEMKWLDAQGNELGNDLTLQISEVGIYIFELFNPTSLCLDRDTVEVFPSAPPQADAGADQWINCFNNYETQLLAAINSNWTYNWTGPNGFSSNVAQPIITEAGEYLLEVVDLTTGCGSDSDVVTVVDGYELNIDFAQSICNDFDGRASVSQTGIVSPTYDWSNGENTATITDLAPGIYSVTVGSEVGDCTEELMVNVTADLSCKVTIAGVVYDDRENGDCDPDDEQLVVAPEIPVTIMPLGLTVFTDQDGYYEFIVDTGEYSLSVEAPEPYFVLCPGFQTIDLQVSDTSAVITDNYFFLDYLTNFDLTVNAYATGSQAGGDQNIQVQYCNYFFQTINGRIEFIHDPKVTFDPVANGADFYNPDTYTASWLYAGLTWFECEWLNFNVQIPSDLPDGTIIEHTVVGRPLLGDLQPGNNVQVITRSISNSSNTSVPQGYINPGATQMWEQDLSVFPNPAKDQFIIRSAEKENEILSVDLLDLMGKLILNKNISEDGLNEVKIDIPYGVTPGLYLLDINTTGGKISRKLFIQ